MVESMLIELSLRSVALTGVALLVTLPMVRRSAAERHLVWLLTIAGLLALPVLALVGPRLSLPAALSAPIESVAAKLETGAAGRFGLAEQGSIDRANATDWGRSRRDSGSAAALESERSMPNGVSRQFLSLPISVTQGLLTAWLLGIAVTLIRFAAMHARVHRHLNRLDGAEAAPLQRRVEQIRGQLRVGRAVSVLRSPRDESPWAWGFLAPSLVLPSAFDGWSDTQQRQALVHELAHVKRLDHVAGIVAQLCCALYWFNPLVWLAARRLQLEAEQACDDCVLEHGGTATTYAEQLLAIANRVFREKKRSVWIPSMAHRSCLSTRVRSILDPNKRRSTMNTPRSFVFALSAVAVVIPVATLESQESIADINSTEFLQMVQAGPTGSAELERIVDAYVANGREGEAADAIARFMLSTYGTLDDGVCALCAEILATEATPRQHEHFPVLVAAIERVEQRAEAEGNGNMLLQSVLQSVSQSGNRHAMARANYYTLRAMQIGIDESLSPSVVRLLYEQGSIVEALDLARRLVESQASAHYQSEEMEQWVSFLDHEVERRATLTRIIFDSLGLGGVALEGDYLPISKTPPAYPPEAVESGLEGHVVVEFTVTTEGRPEGVTVVDSSNGVFNDSAIAAARQFMYAPRTVDGTPVAVPGVRNKITYVLDR